VTPFAQLKALETRARAVIAGAGGAASATLREWSGLAFRVGHQSYLTERENIREVLMPPALTPVPGAKLWLVGVANVGGQIIPVTDLSAFAGGPPIALMRLTRLVRVNHERNPVGLLVDEVRGFRPVRESVRVPTVRDDLLQAWVRGSYRLDDLLYQHLDLRALIESTAFLDAAAG
jgi:twitching motility protein PilI